MTAMRIARSLAKADFFCDAITSAHLNIANFAVINLGLRRMLQRFLIILNISLSEYRRATAKRDLKMADLSKLRNKILIAAALIITIIVVVSVAAFYCLPSQTPKPDAVTNFHEGAWANYSLSIFNSNGTVASTGNMMASTNKGTYDGKECWVYSENVSYTSTDGVAISDVITYYLDTSTYATLHQTETVTNNGEVAYDVSFNPGDAGFMDTIAIVQNMTVTVTGKSVTVPAGTFSTTQREGPITYASEGTTYDVTSWASTDVPTWGIVKYQFYLGGVLFSEYLLTSYGN
jgi:hypothetical protein